MGSHQALGVLAQSLGRSTLAVGETANCARGAAALLHGARTGQVGILCDYDVDGATSQAILVEAVRKVQPSGTPEPMVVVPERNSEGFGPNDRCLRELAEAGVSCVAVLDCGTVSGKLLDGFHRETGIPLVVIDHHPPHEAITPRECVLVNPWASQGGHPAEQGTLCAAGLTWFVGRSMLRQAGHARGEVADVLRRITLLAALGTSCDMVRLDTPFNRSLVRKGVELLGDPSAVPPGLAALQAAAGLQGKPCSDDLNWRLGPRLNAGSRMGKPGLAPHCLRSRNPDTARKLAKRLDRLNRRRRKLGDKALDEINRSVDTPSLQKGPVNVQVVKNATPGTVGLVASSLVRRFGWPAVVLTVDPQGDLTGSGRSALGFDLGSAVSDALTRGILTRGGGHAAACGVGLEPSRMSDLATFLQRRFRIHAEKHPGPRVPTREIDAVLDGHTVDSDMLMAIAEAQRRLEPWGQGFPLPRFGVQGGRLVTRPRIRGNHIFLTVGSQDAAWNAVWWSAPHDWTLKLGLDPENPPAPSAVARAAFDLVGRVDLDEWNNRRTGRLVISDARPRPDLSGP